MRICILIISIFLFSDINSLQAQTFSESKMLSDINYIRSKGRYCGGKYYHPVAPVRWSETLELVANKHSADMYKGGYFSHVDKKGLRVGNRADQLGYDYKVIGENIAVGYHQVNEVLVGWLESDEHCACIMNPYFREVGVSRVGDYWTQVFGITRPEALKTYGERAR